MIIETGEFKSPIGVIDFAVRDGRLCALDFRRGWRRRLAALERRFGKLNCRAAADPAGVATRLQKYFAGEVGSLEDLEVDPGGTRFQQRVWRAMRGIAPGGTLTYTALARAIGSPDAARAVGAASGANRISIVIPCHRAVGANGSLTGYGGGIARKRWLLRHEGAARSDEK